MIIKVRKVYFCEFCSKHSLRPMPKHELHCTMNPSRICRLCGREENLSMLVEKWKKIKEEITKEKDKYNDGIPGEVYDELQKKVFYEKIMKDLDLNCPLCCFSIIRQTGLNHFPFETGFKLEEELKKWWEEINSERREEY